MLMTLFRRNILSSDVRSRSRSCLGIQVGEDFISRNRSNCASVKHSYNVSTVISYYILSAQFCIVAAPMRVDAAGKISSRIPMNPTAEGPPHK